MTLAQARAGTIRLALLFAAGFAALWLVLPAGIALP